MTEPADDRFQRYLTEAANKLAEAATQLKTGDGDAARISMKRGIDLVAGARSIVPDLDEATDHQLFSVTRAVNVMLVNPSHLEPPTPLLAAARLALAGALQPKASA